MKIFLKVCDKLAHLHFFCPRRFLIRGFFAFLIGGGRPPLSWRRRKRRRRKISDKSGLGRSGRGGGLLPVKTKKISHVLKHEEATEKWTQYIRPTYSYFRVFFWGERN